MKSAKDAALLLEEIRMLMALRGENPFKIKAYERAILIAEEHPDLPARARLGTLMEIGGIGKGISEVLTEFFLTGRSSLREELVESVPLGLPELTRVPGLGPKKALELIQGLGLRSLAELESACMENRLLTLKGFGEKVQRKILEGVRFLISHQGEQRLYDVLKYASIVKEEITHMAGVKRVEETGALRRRVETLSTLDFLVQADDQRIDLGTNTPFPIKIHYADVDHFGFEWANTTATPEHWKRLGSPKRQTYRNEEALFDHLELPYIPAECRETGEEITLARAGKFPKLMESRNVQGVFHNHTTYSDGGATLERMVVGARALGWKYIGIADHSQSATYARGLVPAALEAQEKEIKKLQKKYPDIKIFWGIESDVLADGSLDYEDGILKKFDFVVASVHSRFQMNRKDMTERLVKAIQNPYTRFLGHSTGRLLLSRPGYDIDMERIIKEAAEHDVAIEINSNPWRLDIDWRWGPALRQMKTFVSINPDAHAVEELKFFDYGVTVARKALLPMSQVLNAKSASEVEKWLSRK